MRQIKLGLLITFEQERSPKSKRKMKNASKQPPRQ
jgi:hypothetical protein